MSVSPAAFTAAAENEIISLRHIDDNFAAFGILNHSSGWNGKDNILAVCAVELIRHTVTAVFGDELMTVFVFSKRGISVFYAENDVSAVSAVTAVGTAVRNVFFSVKADCAVTAVACFHVYLYIICDQNITSFVYEF